VSQTLLAAAKGAAREGLQDEKWLRRAGRLGRQSQEELQAEIQDFLDTDVLNISVEQCSNFLNPLIESWDIDLKSFNLEVRLSKGLASRGVVRFEYAEASVLPGAEEEPGFKEFLRNPGMSGDASDEELAFLKSLKFHRLRPVRSTTIANCRAYGIRCTSLPAPNTASLHGGIREELAMQGQGRRRKAGFAHKFKLSSAAKAGPTLSK